MIGNVKCWNCGLEFLYQGETCPRCHKPPKPQPTDPVKAQMLKALKSTDYEICRLCDENCKMVSKCWIKNVIKNAIEAAEKEV